MKKPQFYKLDGHNVVPVDDMLEWGRWFGTSNRRVNFDEIGPFDISTVFIGLDYSWGEGDPLIFETMIFGPEDSELNEWQSRCSTWEQAEAIHKVAVELVRTAFN